MSANPGGPEGLQRDPAREAGYPAHRYTFEEYLALEREAPTRSEFHDGEILGLAGASVRHNQIVVNITTSLRLQFRGGPCRAYGSDLKVWIASERRAVYPDVTLVCGEHRYPDGMKDVLENPRGLVEVLSPTTESYDRGAKLRSYLRIPTLVEYLLVSQTEARVERYVRETPDSPQWIYDEVLGDTSIIQLRSALVQLRLSDIYEDVEADQA